MGRSISPMREETGAGSDPRAAPRLIVPMSLQLVIPRRVALQQSSPPLHQPSVILKEKRKFEKEKPLNGKCANTKLSQRRGSPQKRVSEIVPAAQFYSEFLCYRTEIVIGDILWVYRCPDPGAENPITFTKQFHPFEQSRWYWNASFRALRLCSSFFPLIDAASNVNSVSFEIRPVDSDGLSNSKPRCGKKDNQGCVRLFQAQPPT